MQIDVRLRATTEEINRVFDFDEVLNIKYFEYFKDDIYKVSVRIPECELKDSCRPIKLNTFREKVIKACPDSFHIVATATYSDNSKRIIYASSEYWVSEYADILAKKNNLKLVDLKIEIPTSKDIFG